MSGFKRWRPRLGARLVLSLLALGLGAPPVLAETAEEAEPSLRFYGDFRLRLESDYDSLRADGTPRDDRDRLRFRLRLGLEYRPKAWLRLGVRLRSGASESHQSPHVTLVDFDDGPTGDADFDLDRWFARVEGSRSWLWVGRGGLPLWKQNELFWDDDVAPVGIAAGTTWGDSRDSDRWPTWRLNTGVFTLPVGMRDFAGHLAVAQGVAEWERWTVAAGLLAYDADPDDPDAGRLLRGAGLRDAELWIGSVQARFTLAGRPWVTGVDLVHNGRADDAGDGLVLSTRWGSTRDRGDWRLGYTFAEIEARAVLAPYAEDDWVRWGSAVETRGVDFEGHELRFDYTLARGLGLVARGYFVESLSSVEDGKRLRVDLNYRF